MRIYHHNDADGRCAAAVALKHLQAQGEEPTLIEMDYSKEVDVDLIAKGERVIIVDFSFAPDVMKKVLEKTDAVTWIDHHATAEAYNKEYGRKLPGTRNFEEKAEAGCELAWRHFFPDDPAPQAVRLVGDYDKWAHKLRDSIPFFEGLKTEPGADNPRSDIWSRLLKPSQTTSNAIDRITLAGRTAIQYRDSYCKEMRTAYGYETDFGGYRCYALGVFGFGSKAMADNMKKFDVCIGYIHGPKGFTVSLYSDKDNVDVGKICKSQGGGGHKGAAGFSCKTLPFKPVDTDDDSK